MIFLYIYILDYSSFPFQKGREEFLFFHSSTETKKKGSSPLLSSMATTAIAAATSHQLPCLLAARPSDRSPLLLRQRQPGSTAAAIPAAVQVFLTAPIAFSFVAGSSTTSAHCDATSPTTAFSFRVHASLFVPAWMPREEIRDAAAPNRCSRLPLHLGNTSSSSLQRTSRSAFFLLLVCIYHVQRPSRSIAIASQLQEHLRSRSRRPSPLQPPSSQPNPATDKGGRHHHKPPHLVSCPASSLSAVASSHHSSKAHPTWVAREETQGAYAAVWVLLPHRCFWTVHCSQGNLVSAILAIASTKQEGSMITI